MERMTSRQQQASITKEKIRSTAYSLLMENSYESLTMSRIAAEAGVSVGTLYHHYKSKEELFLSCYQDFDIMLEELADQYQFASSIEAIRSLIYAQTVGAFLRGSYHMMSCLYSIQLSTHCDLYFGQKRILDQHLHRLVRQAVDDGEFRQIENSAVIAETILRSGRSAIFHCALRATPEDIASIAMHDLDLVLAHYMTHPPVEFPPVNMLWFDTYCKRIATNK